jgi:hypothetical protein
MGSLVPVFSDNIKMEDMTLDFSLEATRSDYPDQSFSYDGKDTVIGPYKDGYAFGITSIEIDTSLNMQPQIEITFKDLYGNLVFKSGGGGNYSKLFELPPPKFTLTFKGYVGKPIKYVLQLRSTSVNYVTSDGSYEIKCKFVPNIYGFFGDIPYKFIYSVDKLKEGRGTPLNSSSTLNIVKNGNLISETVQTASEQFEKIKSKLNTLLGAVGDGSSLYAAVAAGTFSNNGTAYQVDNIPGDAALTGAGFKSINFNFNNKAASGNYIPYTADTNLYGLSIVRSINQAKKIDLTVGGWGDTTRSLSGTSGDLTKIIQGNLTAIENATNKSAGSQISQEVLDSQTISSVMGSLAGEAAYVLGYILEGALVGLKNAPEEKRRKDDTMIGLYYPLVYKTNNTAGANGDTVYEQIPDPNAVKEMQHVQKFMKAQYEGTQQIKKWKEEQEAKQNGTEGAIQQGFELKKRLTNAEAFKANPYAGQNSQRIAANMIMRSGLVASEMCGPFTNDRNKGLIDSEYENIKIGTDVLTGNELEAVRTFAKRVTTFFDVAGKPKLNWTDPTDGGNTTTYQTYFESFFESMKGMGSGLDDKMFLAGKKSELTCLYFISNNVLYNSEDELENVFGDSKDIYVYVPSDKAALTSTSNSTGAADVSEKLNGSGADTTKPYESPFYAFQDATKWDGLGGAGNPTLVISYDKLTGGGYLPVNQTTIKIAKTAADGVVVPAEGDYVAPFARTKDKKNWVVSMKHKSDTVAPLVSWCTTLLSQLPQDNSEANKRKAEQEKQAASGSNDGTSTETQGPEPYTFDTNVYNAIYHQFHHIANAWSNVLAESLKGQDYKALADKERLAEAMEEAYRNDKPNATLSYSMSFAMAMQMSNVTDETLKKAIINTSSLVETDTESSTFAMMSNVAQQNNFLLQAIPGGLKSGSDEFDIDSLFKPVLSYQRSDALGSAALCFIWQPTPESRSLNNKGEFIYGDADKFKASLDSLPSSSKIAWFQFGSPDNIIVKSIKATTDENKVTGESIAAVDDIISPDNQNKKRAFDCSMLSVMQGRSYKIGMEILGNANFLPTQRFAITNMPIFTGLYWTSNVKHSITPNSMVTNIEAMKLKYDGGNWGGVLPITSATYKGDTGTFGGGGGGGTGGGGGSGTGGGGGENILTDGLNWDYLQKIKDEKMRNATEINAFIKKATNGAFSDYPTWFNAKVKGNTFCSASIDSASWTKVWNSLIPIVWSDYGTGGIKFIEYLCINIIMNNEEKYDPSVAITELEKEKRRVTKYNKSISFKSKDKDEIETFLKSLKIGDIIWYSDTLIGLKDYRCEVTGEPYVEVQQGYKWNNTPTISYIKVPIKKYYTYQGTVSNYTTSLCFSSTVNMFIAKEEPLSVKE